MKNRKLDWRSRHDDRSLSYPIRSILNNRKIEIKKVMWQEGTVLDQGSEGACVGFGWMAELLAEPVSPVDQPSPEIGYRYAINYYNRAKQIDEWPGENYDGTSVLAGAKVMHENGLIGSYRWCFSIEDIRDAVISEGPVVIGIPWNKNMYTTLRNGLVNATGAEVGGHCLTITGYDPAMVINGKEYEVFRWRNSWGNDYGLDGSAYIKYTDLQKLIAAKGEACVPMQRKPISFKKNWLQTLLNRFLVTE